MSSSSKKTVSLVLGSGGARGFAHIGVIHWLEEHDFEIRSISGSSMGALIGGIHAAGKLDDYERWVRAIRKVDILALLDLSWQMSGLVKGDKIINTLIDMVGDTRIEDMKIRYTAVAVNINNGKEIWITRGPMFDAIRASISMPLFFTPYRWRNALLIDGGVLNPVPIAPTFGDGTDITIAVSLSGEPKKKQKVESIDKPERENDSSFRAAIGDFIENLKSATGRQTAEDIDWAAYEIALQAFEAMQETIARQKLATYPPDRTIEIPRDACRVLDFDRAADMIELGYRLAEERLAELKE